MCTAPLLAQPAKPTFTKDIAPILFDRCVQCHRAGDIGPMPLVTYEQTRPWSAAIQEAVLKRRMPPWFAGQAPGVVRTDGPRRDAPLPTAPARLRAGGAHERAGGHRNGMGRERRRAEAAENTRVASAAELAAKIEAVSLTFSARVGEEGKLFGSVTSGDIFHQLEAQGFSMIEKRMIDLPEPIRALGVYRVAIKLHADVKPEIKVWVIKG